MRPVSAAMRTLPMPWHPARESAMASREKLTRTQRQALGELWKAGTLPRAWGPVTLTRLLRVGLVYVFEGPDGGERFALTEKGEGLAPKPKGYVPPSAAKSCG